MVKISAQFEHISVLILKVSHSKFWLFQPIFRHLDPGSEYGSEYRPNLNADPTGSGSVTLSIYNNYIYAAYRYVVSDDKNMVIFRSIVIGDIGHIFCADSMRRSIILSLVRHIVLLALVL